MRSGRLRSRLVLQSKTYTTNAYGEQVVGWSTEATVWGAIEPLSGKEFLAQQQIQAETMVRIVLRYRSDITTAWRITNDGLYYDVVDILNDGGRNRTLTIHCRQGVSEDVGTTASAGSLLLEAGDYILLESGDQLLLES